MEPSLPADPAPSPYRRRRPMLRCFNVKYSPNLGDGLLSECLERELIALGADPATSSIDLAARKAYGDAMTGRDTVMKVLDALPGSLRRLAVRAPLKINGERKWRPHYRDGLRHADAAVIGGGNLISDLDLNFPTKLSLALEEADRLGLPTVIFGSGVGSPWSAAGLRMCRSAFSRPTLRGVFVRDDASKLRWDTLMTDHTGHVAEVVRDPGLLASDLYPGAPKRPEGRPVTGLGIMSPIAIRYHGPEKLEAADLEDWYVEVAKQLSAEGHAVAVFTNGSPEDRTFAEHLRPRLAQAGRHVAFPTQRTPRELCRIISACDAVIAFRMHAVIAAYSYQVPAVALAWDSKLDAFMQSVERGAWLRSVTDLEPHACVSMISAALAKGIDPAEHRKVLDDARQGIGRAFKTLETALSSTTLR